MLTFRLLAEGLCEFGLLLSAAYVDLMATFVSVFHLAL